MRDVVHGAEIPAPEFLRAGRRRAALRLSAFALGIALLAILLHRLGLARYDSAADVVAAVADLRRHPVAPPAVALIFGAAATVGLPITPFALAAGAVFGFWTGLLVSIAGALLGAIGGYAVARLVGRSAVVRLFGPRWYALERLCGCTSRSAHVRRRLIVLIPFALLSYAGGLARMPMRDFLAATAIGTFPALVIFNYFAHALVAGAARAQRQALWHLAAASALLLLLSFAPALMRRLGWTAPES